MLFPRVSGEFKTIDKKTNEEKKSLNENEENDEERQRVVSLNGDTSEHLLLTGSKLLEQHAI